MKKMYPHMAKMILKSRGVQGDPGYVSQSELASSLGYKNGQYISNVERELSTLPDTKIIKLAEQLKVSTDLVIQTKLDDIKHNLERLIQETSTTETNA